MGKEKLVGCWTLEAASSINSAGERDDTPYGLGPSGFLTYGDDDRMTALISYGGRKPLSPITSPSEQAEAFKTFFAYAGRYTLTENQLVHHVEISSIQNYVNRDLARTIRFEGNCIVLITPPSLVNGKIQTIELTWRRLPASSR